MSKLGKHWHVTGGGLAEEAEMPALELNSLLSSLLATPFAPLASEKALVALDFCRSYHQVYEWVLAYCGTKGISTGGQAEALPCCQNQWCGTKRMQQILQLQEKKMQPLNGTFGAQFLICVSYY